MDRKFSVTEPHPTVPKSSTYYLASGIGGAGNYRRYNAQEVSVGVSATGPASRVPLNKHYNRAVTVGRGGAGNHRWVAPETEQKMFEFDEEMISAREAQAPVYHIGRGGAANWINESKTKTTRQGSSSSSHSVSSTESGARRSIEGVLGKLQRAVSRQ